MAAFKAESFVVLEAGPGTFAATGARLPMIMSLFAIES